MGSTLTFCGGAGSVTGANFLLSTDDIKILVDCGLVQDERICHGCNYDDFAYDPKEIDILLVTHAHLDHIGRIPKLVKDGFKGVIYSTPATRELTEVMFANSLALMSEEAKKEKREPLYDKNDVTRALSLWKTIPYHTTFELAPGYSVFLKDAGHILGSSMFEITHARADEDRKIAFTGDLGNSPMPLLRDTEILSEETNYVLMESVYGDRNHESNMEERTELLKEVIQKAIERGGTLLIPVFAIERTQIILHEINHLVEDGHIKSVPVYLDAPLAIEVTEIYKHHMKNFGAHVQADIASGDDIFSFPKLKLTVTRDQSKDIMHDHGPKIILAGSGMSYGGRIMYHEKLYLSDPKSTILFVGYQVPGTLGRMIQDGNKTVEVLGKKIHIKAHVESISGFSAHKDSDHLVEFMEPLAETDELEKVFVAMGEPKASMYLAQRLHDYLEMDAIVPKQGERFDIDF